MLRSELAKRIYTESHLTGEFVLRSGAIATEYFDKYRFENDPVLLRAITEAMLPSIPPRVDGLAGLELGGVPLATMLSQLSGLPLYSVRKKPKEYGTRQFAEGGEIVGRRLVIVEDVITSGGQAVISASDLRKHGATVDTVLCVIDRQAGGEQALRSHGLTLKALFTMAELKAAADGRQLA